MLERRGTKAEQNRGSPALLPEMTARILRDIGVILDVKHHTSMGEKAVLVFPLGEQRKKSCL